MPVAYPDSVGKNLAQLAIVSKHPFLGYEPPKQLIVSESFFRGYGCYLHCGGCCPQFSLDYTLPEWEQFSRHYPDVQGVRKEHHGTILMTIPNEGQKINGHMFCKYLDPDRAACNIHLMNPYSCQAELIKFRRIRNKGYIMKAPFGRAWNITKIDGTKGDLLCTFDKQIDWVQLQSNDIPVLRRLQSWAEAFNIYTHLPEIIKELQSMVMLKSWHRIVLEN